VTYSSINGLYVFRIDNADGNLKIYFNGDTPPNFSLDDAGHLIWAAPDDPEHTLDLGKVAGASISSISVMYQIGSSGVTAPSGEWSPTVPAPQQGKFLWTRTNITVVDGGTSTVITGYSVSYYGIDGTSAPVMSFAIDGDDESPTYGHLMLTLS
jgi:hypothetical protein